MISLLSEYAYVYRLPHRNRPRRRQGSHKSHTFHQHDARANNNSLQRYVTFVHSTYRIRVRYYGWKKGALQDSTLALTPKQVSNSPEFRVPSWQPWSLIWALSLTSWMDGQLKLLERVSTHREREKVQHSSNQDLKELTGGIVDIYVSVFEYLK